MNLKIGQRVIVNGHQDDGYFDDAKGVIVRILDYTGASIGVGFDKQEGFMHNCQGFCAPKYGYYVRPNMVRVVKGTFTQRLEIDHGKTHIPNFLTSRSRR